MNKKIVKALNDEIKNEIVRRESSQNQKAANGHGLVSSQLPTANEIHNRHRHLTSNKQLVLDPICIIILILNSTC